MPEPEDENIPFLHPVTAPGRDEATDEDDQDFSTLVEIKKTLDDAMASLYKDFNAFDIVKLLETNTVPETRKKLLIQILGKQEAYDILMPIQSTVDSAVEDVMRKRKGH